MLSWLAPASSKVELYFELTSGGIKASSGISVAAPLIFSMVLAANSGWCGVCDLASRDLASLVSIKKHSSCPEVH